MKAHRRARAHRAEQPLSVGSMAQTLRRILPKRNFDGPIHYEELLSEAQHFGVLTNRQFRALMLRHRRALLAADQEHLTPQLERIYRGEWGEKVVSDRLRRQFWWTWEGLTRLAFGFEFGETYEKYVQQRYAV